MPTTLIPQWCLPSPPLPFRSHFHPHGLCPPSRLSIPSNSSPDSPNHNLCQGSFVLISPARPSRATWKPVVSTLSNIFKQQSSELKRMAVGRYSAVFQLSVKAIPPRRSHRSYATPSVHPPPHRPGAGQACVLLCDLSAARPAGGAPPLWTALPSLACPKRAKQHPPHGLFWE